MSLRESKLYIYLVVIALISGWLVKLTDFDEIFHTQVPVHSPDYFSSNYTKWEMSDLGTLKSKVLADKMTHYSDDGTTHMVNPIMFFYNEKTPPWVINSETGILSSDGKDLLLNGKVIVNREKAEGVAQLTINTSELKVKPETSYAETDQWAELISPPNTTTGTGMKMTFAQPIHLQLLANVKGKYETK
ncbi:LPS export ABC transporter periplasmic protein LptC [Methylobacter psychrophilus]|uniref:LPS export ABC transporter periplasmic protein LptC n=1 Tax=Methylobacter psychrophilus TaxID=96941 RepID=UPI0021D495C0|nr:LPS export ABC transporter periplasmic protein LptC [Methylobacter psychrophilus]